MHGCGTCNVCNAVDINLEWTEEGEIKKKWSVEIDKGAKYFVQYKFSDRRSAITSGYLYLTVDNFSCHFLSRDIIFIIVDYLDGSFTFWYGPYRNTIQVVTREYMDLSVGSKIDVAYDINDPANNSTNIAINSWRNQTVLFWSVISLFMYGAFGGMIYALLLTMDSPDIRSDFENELQWELIAMIIWTPSIIIASLVVLCRCFREETFCFALRRSHTDVNCSLVI